MITVSQDRLKDFIGEELGPSDWLQVTQDQVNEFANSTLDRQYIHIDEDANFGDDVSDLYPNGIDQLLYSDLCVKKEDFDYQMTLEDGENVEA